MKITNLSEEKLDNQPTYERKLILPEYRAYEKGYYNPDYPRKKIISFLLNRVGKDWNDVISEFVKLEWIPIRFRNFTTLIDFVEINTLIKDNEVHYYNNFNFLDKIENILPISNLIGYLAFYVHPETFVLHKIVKPRFKWKRRKDDTFIPIEDYKHLYKIKNIWYFGWVDNNYLSEKYKPKTRLFDKDGEIIYSKDIDAFDRTLLKRFYIHKKQLNKKQLKQYKLK